MRTTLCLALWYHHSPTFSTIQLVLHPHIPSGHLSPIHFFSFCLMPIPWARRKQYEGPTWSWGLLSLIYCSSYLFSEVYPSKYIEYLAQLIIFRLSSPTDVWHTMLLCLLIANSTVRTLPIFPIYLLQNPYKPSFPQTPYSHRPDWTPALFSNPLMYILALFSMPFLLPLILSAPFNHKDTCS